MSPIKVKAELTFSISTVSANINQQPEIIYARLVTARSQKLLSTHFLFCSPPDKLEDLIERLSLFLTLVRCPNRSTTLYLYGIGARRTKSAFRSLLMILIFTYVY